MSVHCNRRRFLASTSAIAGLALLRQSGIALAADDPLYRISLAQWSLHKAIFAGKLDKHELTQAEIDEAIAHIDAPEVAAGD